MSLRFDLKNMLNEYEAKTGVRVSYVELASKCSVSPDTIKSLGARIDYTPSLDLVNKIAMALNSDPRPYLVWVPR